MSSAEKIGTAFDRTVKALTLKPALGKGTGLSVSRIKDGLTCETTEGNWKVVSDMGTQVGGNSSAPTPGVYGRAALGSCLAIGYVMYAAKLGVPITSLEVEVQADYDDGPLFGVGNLPPGYIEVRYNVTIESPASEQDVMRVIDEGDVHSPYLDIFSRGQRCVRNVKILSPQ
jgi:uncharacterized OsmC-like protein